MDSIVISEVAQRDTTDREAFWQNHYELLSSSGLSRAEYCRRNNLIFVPFKYWIKKFSCTTAGDSKLVAGLTRFLEDGCLEVGNNLIEQAIKPFVMARKNFLFSSSVEGMLYACT